MIFKEQRRQTHEAESASKEIEGVYLKLRKPQDASKSQEKPDRSKTKEQKNVREDVRIKAIEDAIENEIGDENPDFIQEAQVANERERTSIV